MVACYYGLSCEWLVNVIYGVGSELMDTTSGHLAWDKNTITNIAEGTYYVFGSPIGLQANEGKDGVHGIVAISDETAADAGHIEIVTVPNEVCGKIAMSTLQE